MEPINNQPVIAALSKHPLFVRHTTHRRPRVTPFHRQPGIELHFCHSGRGSFHLFPDVLLQRRGHVVVLPGSRPHQVFADVHSGYRRTALCVGEDLIDRLRDTSWTRDTVVSPSEAPFNVTFPIELWREVEQDLLHINREYTRREAGWEQLAVASLVRIFVNLGRARSQRICRGNDLLERTIGLIETQLDQDLSVASLARSLGVSPKYLSSHFSSTMAMPLTQYVLHRRIEMAKHLLDSKKHLLIEAIALSCGFKTAAHFSRRFSDVTGVSPSEYRKAHFGSPKT